MTCPKNALLLAVSLSFGAAACEGADGDACQIDEDCNGGLVCCATNGGTKTDIADPGLCRNACSSIMPQDMGTADSGSDSGTADSGTDAEIDAPVDGAASDAASGDAGGDSGADAAEDTGSDAAEDTGSDA